MQQDKTDWYWNGVLAGAVNNLYYDLINVDVVHVPYATHHRNSSFFLKTRLAYSLADVWESSDWYSEWYEVTDIKIIWDEKCDKTTWTVYALARRWNSKRIYATDVKDWCVTWRFFNCSCQHASEEPEPGCSLQQEWCWDWRLFVTNYVRWSGYFKDDTVAESHWVLQKIEWTQATEVEWKATWIQINKYENWTMYWQFSDDNIENWYAEWWNAVKIWMYLLVYRSANWEFDWHAWQVRMVTEIWSDGRLTLDAPWQWFKTYKEDEATAEEQEFWWNVWKNVQYAFFSDWWEVLGYTDNRNINIIYNHWDCRHLSVYDQSNNLWWWVKSNIIWVADTNDKIFVLTDNWYIHYNSLTWGRDKFFIQDDMFAWVDKTSITSYRDMVLAFGRKHISIWVPDDNNEIYTMYNQSTTIWLWSRYSYAEYDWDLLIVSNDKRLLAFWVASTAWRYMLQHEDVWKNSWLNWKLSALLPWDEVFIWSDDDNLRVFVNTSDRPYKPIYKAQYTDLTWNKLNMTHIYKFDKLFSVWTEDHIDWLLLKWASEDVYYGEWGIYIRKRDNKDNDEYEFKTIISAYLIENEADWTGWNSSWLASRPKLYNLAKLNRLITTLWPWEYSNNTKIKVTAYSKWIWYTYEFPVDGDWNVWLWLMTGYYNEEELSPEDAEHLECIIWTIEDNHVKYEVDPNWVNMWRVQASAQQQPRCDNYDELLVESHWVHLNDKIYELAPTMPLTTNLWETMDYATQIKLELIWEKGDVICFGWWLAEMFISPLFTTWPDWEYQLQPNTDC